MEDHRILIDTSVFIDYFRKVNKEKSILYQLSASHTLVTSAVCYFEVLVGVNSGDLAFIRKMFSKIEILPFSTDAAQKSAAIYKQLKARNQLIEFRDIFIGATAIMHDIALATLNFHDFDRIPELKIYK